MRILLLGGTGEARELARLLTGEREHEIVSSLAGRVSAPIRPVGEVRVGGFGGADGLRDWLADNRMELVIDATHPFAGVITANAAQATARLGLPMIRLSRPGWTAGPGDRWYRVPDLAAAADTAAGLGDRVLLTIGRQGVAAFAGHTRPWYLIRAIDPPTDQLPPRHEILLARGPFTVSDESELLTRHRIDVVVTKDSGGTATAAKLTAARIAGIPVVVVDRPTLPSGVTVVTTVDEAREVLSAWVAAGRSGRPGGRR
ncbi:cobalt-precorrin-6A reductase [Nocardia grenadensis]|uniref:cobalt-precorrin-6A reductase n=1 Tax=Nocardia grenadensis TaxID=931537 RepID=UPI0007A50FBC|nr:cobalt-precorrin-6A reductase [Nocardia grenadensis]